MSHKVDKDVALFMSSTDSKAPSGAPTGPKAWGAGGAMKSVFAAPDPIARRNMAVNSTARSRTGGQSSLGGSQYPVQLGKPYPYNNKFGSVLKKSEYRAGMIISAYHVERDGYQRLEPNNARQSVTNEGTIAYEKERKFVVLRVFATHLTVLPIFTNEGKGLENKEHKNHFISIRECDDQETAAPAQSKHPILWADAEAYLKDGNPWNKMSNTACVHFTNPKEHRLSWPAKIMGKLTRNSLIILISMFNEGFNAEEYDEDINPSPEPPKRRFDGSQVGRPNSSEAGRPNGSYYPPSQGRGTYAPARSTYGKYGQ